MVVWLLETSGRAHRLRYPYAPTLYMAGSRQALRAARRVLDRLAAPVTCTPVLRRDLRSGDEVPVVAVTVGSPLAYPAAARMLSRVPGLTVYTCDIPTPRLFFYETGLFPLARCAVACRGDVIQEVDLRSRIEDLEYDLPPLTVLRIRPDPDGLPDDPDLPVPHPGHGRPGRLEVSVDGETVVLDGDDPADLVRSLQRMLQRYDPDIILTEWGDAVLLPGLLREAARTGQDLGLNRDPGRPLRIRRPRSYVTYGQVVHQAGARLLAGRWHLDLRNSFIYAESELAGVLEVARLSCIPVQDLARTSTGTAISSMQLRRAVQDGILVPWQKSEPEEFKTASQLLLTDKGGLTYQPLVGLYEQVGELDFSSMYPTLMATYNISPETVGCGCCPESRVPEIGVTVCRRRRGLVPQVLDHLLARRAYYKRRRRETAGSQRALYDQRQTALKWCLVTSFGYLGYRNARFGRIEAHEAVTAYAREMLLRAKETAESRGFRMLHALVDSLWLYRPGATPADYEDLAQAVSRATGLPIAVEGVYRWVAFLPSRTHPGVGVPNRYLGVFTDGTTKVRGIEARRSDMPALVVRTQERMLRRLFRCPTLADARAALPEVLAVLEDALLRVRAGEVTAADLVITTRLSQEVSRYRHNTAQALAARALARAGVRVSPGEPVQYILVDAGARVPRDRVRPYGLRGDDWHYDREAYATLLLRAAATVLEPFGYGEDRLRREVWEPISAPAPAAWRSPGRCGRTGPGSGC
ncbi:MAG: DNA polymerase domain-containing protein [Armatimonadota bacterium]|nr:DNA polymerase domain-containing protein [Armatimonadota bacterium]MDR7436611.1 DNA polymerase domain-containing protein [Armatimonadota bacterium]MDR7472970.1 DNA polymerase domain-containing protein [Armatimonadota bacterium]MDR7506622.1 DNA polymerase domain-containing protein [Armatimonadota bacterium]MDR7509142.1 DNA polymerase domain-containing protein [Armatimonadota bacterium]